MNDVTCLARLSMEGVGGIGTGAILAGVVELADLPLSLGGDILTLPWTTYVYLREQEHPSGWYSGIRVRIPDAEPTETTGQAKQPTDQ